MRDIDWKWLADGLVAFVLLAALVAMIMVLSACTSAAGPHDSVRPTDAQEPLAGTRHNSFLASRQECIAEAKRLTGGTARIGALDTPVVVSGTHSRGGWSCTRRQDAYHLNVGWYR